MSHLPGTVRLDDQGADGRAELLARHLVRIHRLPVTARQRPRAYQPWASPERVTAPTATAGGIRRSPPRPLYMNRHPRVSAYGRVPALRVSSACAATSAGALACRDAAR